MKACDAFEIEVVTSKTGTISHVQVRHNNKYVLVSGSARRNHGYSSYSGGHIDIKLITDNGKILLTKSEKIKFQSNSGRGGSKKQGSFSVSLPSESLKRVKVMSLQYYSGLHTFHKTKEKNK